MESPSQLLSLKVMRVSRPAIATAWEPFYSSSSSFSAHSTASVMSLQGKNPLPGHPKTLRDLTHISEMLMLPSAFGTIQLGETFSSCLSVNNEVPVDVVGVTLRAEMQTATTKSILADYGGPEFSLAAGDTLENVVHHEIKELGQHVLACTVTYRLPAGYRSAHPASDLQDPETQSFRKFYKFAVTNPLSVKTKVHVPRSPTALLSPTEREKVFLEVHIQNLTPDALWLQHMRFESTEGWKVEDINLTSHASPTEEPSIFSGSMALIQPQDTRQYVYILSPKILAPLPIAHLPGTIIPLGRLDISWRSAFGEPGRLLTSMLSRRIPLIQAPAAQAPIPPPKQPASALPLHLQRNNTLGPGTPPRVQSPQLNQRPMSPPVSGAGPAPYRPGSPFRTRTNTSTPLASHPHSPNLSAPLALAARKPEDMDADVIVRHIPRQSLAVEKPFNIKFTVTVAAPVPPARLGLPRKQRILTLAIQHVQPPRPQATIPTTTGAPASAADLWSPRLPSSSGFSTPSPYATPARGDFPDSLSQRLLVASPRRIASDLQSDVGTDTDGPETGQDTPAPPGQQQSSVAVLPPPFSAADTSSDGRTYPKDVVFLGPSAIFLPQIRLSAPPVIENFGREHGHERNISESTTDSEADSDAHETIGGSVVRALASQDFELQFLPLRSGFATVGGLRILLVEDRVVDETDAASTEMQLRPLPEVKTLKELDVVAEVWVKTALDD